LLGEGFPEAYREVVNDPVPAPQHPVLGSGTCSVLQDRHLWGRGKAKSGRPVFRVVASIQCSSMHNDGVTHEYHQAE